MTDHRTPEPTAAVRIRAGEPGAAAASAAFAELICADDELLRTEFDAIIAANFPGAVEHGHPLGPDTTIIVATTERVLPPRCPTPADRRPGRGRATAAQRLQPELRVLYVDRLTGSGLWTVLFGAAGKSSSAIGTATGRDGRRVIIRTAPENLDHR